MYIHIYLVYILVYTIIPETHKCITCTRGRYDMAFDDRYAYLLRPMYTEYLYVEFVCKYPCVFYIYIGRSRYGRFTQEAHTRFGGESASADRQARRPLGPHEEARRSPG